MLRLSGFAPCERRRRLISSALFAAMLAVPMASRAYIGRPHRQPRQIVHEIEQLEQSWQRAALASDTTAMEPMLSDNYLGIMADGTLATKAETLAAFKSGALHFTTIDNSDRKIRVFGSTVVVTSRAYVSGVSNGQDISGHYRYTRVYHRKDGVWRVVSFEASSVQKPAWQ